MVTPKEIRERFLSRADHDMKEFGGKIIVPRGYQVIGIRTPVMRAFAKEICNGDWRSYLDGIDDKYHEDMILRGFIIAHAKMDDNERYELVRKFIPGIDNWAICDTFCSALNVNKKNADAVWKFIIPYLGTNDEFQIRFAVAMMILHFVNTEYVKNVIRHMETIKHDAYYVKMAVAWCLSVCFIKFPEETMPCLKNNTLDDFTFSKTLSKITDSFRVSDDVKHEIRKMRRK
jgi:3-methyladenine DNA glycosylase AlkD